MSVFSSSLLSLNAGKRREELLLVGAQNHAIYQRITGRQSEYRRQLWLDEWERAERRRRNVAHYPRWPADQQVGGSLGRSVSEGEGNQKMISTVDLEGCLCPAEVKQEGEVCSRRGKQAAEQLQEWKWTDGLTD